MVWAWAGVRRTERSNDEGAERSKDRERDARHDLRRIALRRSGCCFAEGKLIVCVTYNRPCGQEEIDEKVDYFARRYHESIGASDTWQTHDPETVRKGVAVLSVGAHRRAHRRAHSGFGEHRLSGAVVKAA